MQVLLECMVLGSICGSGQIRDMCVYVYIYTHVLFLKIKWKKLAGKQKFPDLEKGHSKMGQLDCYSKLHLEV